MIDILPAADLALTRSSGDEDVEVYGLHRVVTRVEAGGGGDLRQVSRSEVRGLGVRLVGRDRTGYASTTDLTDAGVTATIAAARSAARASAPHPSNRLPDHSPLRQPPRPGLPGCADVGVGVALAVALARRAAGLHPLVATVDTASWREECAEITVVSTRGIRVQHGRRSVEVDLAVVGNDEHGGATGYAGWCGTSTDACDISDLATDAVRAAVDLLGPRQPLPGGLPILLAPEVSATLLTALGRALTGPALSGRGWVTARPGEVVAADTVTLVDDGLCRHSPAAAPFDDEGIPRRRTPLVTNGLLVGALHSTGSVPEGQQSTGNARRSSHRSPPGVAPTTLRLTPTGDTDVRDAVLVRELSGEGAGIRPVTGRIDVGLVAHLLRDGEAAGRLPILPCSTTLRDLWSSVTAVGADARVVPPSPALAPTVMLSPGFLRAGSP